MKSLASGCSVLSLALSSVVAIGKSSSPLVAQYLRRLLLLCSVLALIDDQVWGVRASHEAKQASRSLLGVGALSSWSLLGLGLEELAVVVVVAAVLYLIGGFPALVVGVEGAFEGLLYAREGLLEEAEETCCLLLF